jgi:hypothetical protein
MVEGARVKLGADLLSEVRLRACRSGLPYELISQLFLGSER